MTNKLSIVRFKPKPEYFDEFVKNIQDWHGQVFFNGDHRLMRTDEEVVAIVVRDSEMLQENIKRGVAWLLGGFQSMILTMRAKDQKKS